MNYTQPIVKDYPMSNPITYVAIGVGALWLGSLCIKSAKSPDLQQHMERKHHKGLSRNNVDRQIDERNRVLGGKVPSNPDVPFYSNQNYNRRRRSKNFW